jgi:hypothetical protein
MIEAELPDATGENLESNCKNPENPGIFFSKSGKKSGKIFTHHFSTLLFGFSIKVSITLF